MILLRQGEEADIGLLLEGTYPYVSGGVSSWIAQILRGFPDLRFAICFLGSRHSDYPRQHYELPAQVVHCEAHFMHDADFATHTDLRKRHRHSDPEVVMHLHALQRDYQETGQAQASLDALLAAHAAGRHGEYDLTMTREAWSRLTERYRQHCTDPSFIDYFWTVRIMHQPLWSLMQIAERFPKIRALHAVSTGYAGMLGAMLKRRRRIPLILTEHGIYTKERKIDLFQAQWIRDNRGLLEKDTGEIAYFRQMWIRFFETLGRECYQQADPIIALYENNRQRQILDGAAPERTRNIPNGIDLPRFSALRQQRPAKTPAVVCLIGRIVPIKDIKTFIRAMRSVAYHLPQLQAWIAGPEDEDPAYATECRNLVRSSGLEGQVHFLGFQRIDELLPQIGLIVLSSISEALPLVLLEGWAAGIPCVATDVGSCRQLVEGLDTEDRAIGHAGRVVRIADPEGLGRAIVELMRDEDAWQAASTAGQRRVERYYTEAQMFAAYRDIYAQALTTATVPESKWPE